MNKFLTIIFALWVASFSLTFAGSPRVVLMEEGTNASCGPCASQNPTLEVFYKGLDYSKVVPVIWHPNYPGADVMYSENPTMHQGRIAYYGTKGVPHVLINGKTIPKSSSNYYDGAAADTTAHRTGINAAVGQNSPYTITVKNEKVGNTYTITVNVSSDVAISGNKKLRIVLAESFFAHPNAGSNGEKTFPFVARKMFPDHNGTTLTIGAGSSQEFKFENITYNSTWNAGLMYVAAFIQDDDSKEVLQAASNLSKPATVEVTMVGQQYLKLGRGVKHEQTFKVKNPNASDMDFKLEAKGPTVQGWTSGVPSNLINIKAGETKDVVYTVNTGTNALFASFTLSATPAGGEGINVAFGDEDSFYSLTSDAKYAYYYGGAYFDNWILNSIASSTKYLNDLVFIPTLSQEINNIYPSSQFDVLIYSYDYFGSISSYGGLLSNNYQESNMMRTNITNALNNGKHVLVIAEGEMWNAFRNSQLTTAQTFFKNTFGVQTTTTQTLRISVNGSGQITGVLQYPIAGVANDPISNGMAFTGNAHQNVNSYFGIQTDLMSLVPSSTAIPFLYADGNQSNIVGVRGQKGNGKYALVTNPFSALSTADGKNLYEKIVDWFMGGGSTTEGPKISTSKTSMDFAKTMVGSKDMQEVTITNDGDEDLTFSNIIIESVLTGIFNITEGANLTKITPKQTAKIRVEFVPKDKRDYVGRLRIQSNAKNNNNMEIMLSGTGDMDVSVGEVTFDNGLTLNVTPNPVSAISTINYNVNSGVSANLNIKLVDSKGSIVNEFFNGTVSSGNYSLNINSADYNAGAYFLLVNMNNTVKQIPVMIVK